MSKTLRLNSRDYALRAGTSWTRRPLGAPELGRYAIRPPMGIGLKFGHGEPDRVYSAKNLSMAFASGVTRGPQKQSVTVPAAEIAYTRFDHARGELYAMSRRTSVVAGQTVTKLYFHAASDDRSLTGFPSAQFTFSGSTRTMNGTIGASQTSATVTIPGDSGRVLERFVGPPMASQTIGAQNWTLKIARASTDLGGVNIWGMRLYVFRPATQTAVGYIVGSATTSIDYGTASENTSANTEQAFTDSAFSGSAVTVQNGDVLVCEIHAEEETGGAATGYDATLYFDGTSEVGADNATVSDYGSSIASTNNLTLSGAIPAKVAGRLVYLTTSSAFTDTTIDTDLGVNYVQGISTGSQRLLALSAFPYGGAGGQNMPVLAQSWDGLVWTSTNLVVQNQFLMVDIADVGGTTYILYADDISYPTQFKVATLGSGVLTGSTNVAITAGTTLATVASSVFPLRMVSFPDSAGTERAWVSTEEGLYFISGSNTPTLMRRWADTGSGYSGTVLESTIINGVDSLLFNDGQDVYQGTWVQGGSGSVFEARPLRDPDIAIPEAQQGAVTAVAFSEERGWIFAAAGGLDSTHNGGIFRHFHKVVEGERPKPLIDRPYENATADRIIRALVVTTENNGVSKLIIMEEDAAVTTPTDTDCFMFTYILQDPATVAAYPFNASGLLTTSEYKPREGDEKVGWLAIQAETRDLSATKKLSIKDGQDGAAPANSQDITSATSPAAVWPDQTTQTTTAVLGVGVAAKSQQVEVTLSDSAVNTTTGPTLLELTQTFQSKGLLPDGTMGEVFDFEVDLEASKALSTHRDNPKNVLQALQTAADSAVLVALVLDSGETVYVSATIIEAAMRPQEQSITTQQEPATGFVKVRCIQLVR